MTKAIFQRFWPKRSSLFARPLRFIRGEGGLVTVEWVALAAGVAVGAVVISFIVMDSLVDPAAAIGAQLTIAEPAP